MQIMKLYILQYTNLVMPKKMWAYGFSGKTRTYNNIYSNNHRINILKHWNNSSKQCIPHKHIPMPNVIRIIPWSTLKRNKRQLLKHQIHINQPDNQFYMDPTFRLFSGISISKGKCGCINRIFHADTDPMHRLVPDIHQTCKRRLNVKPIHPADKSGFANHIASDISCDILFKCKHNGLLTTSIFAVNRYCNTVHSSTDCEIHFKW